MTAKIHHADLYGSRQSKYDALTSSTLESIAWEDLAPNVPFYPFLPQEQAYREEYDAWWKVTDVFPVNSVGIVTARDRLTIHFTEKETLETVTDFARLPAEVAREKYKLGPDARDWKVEFAQRDLNTSGKSHGVSDTNIKAVLYRPFDTRYTYYTGHSRGFLCMPRNDVMQHMLAGENVAFITSRMTKGETFQHLQATRNIVEVICMSPKTSNNGFVFPSPEAWAFQVGGYRPAAKWLDDRKDRALTEDDIQHYCRMLAAMRDTAALLPDVDAAFQSLLNAAPQPNIEE